MRARGLSILAGIVLVIAAATINAGTSLPNPALSTNPTGVGATFSNASAVDVTSPFFQSLGSNGRSCGSCHVAATGWTISPPEVQARFKATDGLDPIFRTNDGANCPSADVSTVAARHSAYSQLLDRGLIRVSVSVPAAADFHIIAIDDPYSCPETTPTAPALYRRPLPSTSLPFLTTVMWDGRESTPGNTLRQNLTQQATDATMGHAQGTPPTAAQLEQIVDAEMAIFTAQLADQGPGALNKGGAQGGPMNLSQQDFHVGINDVLGADPSGAPFNPVAFTVYQGWRNSTDPHKAAVARGEDLFNTFPILITGVAGLNDLPGLAAVNGSCTSCHDTPNVGNHSVALAINIGIADYPGRPGLDVSGLPVYTVQCLGGGPPVEVTDLGRALVTGKCKDVGKTKGPILRGLAARAPYFHNGSGKTLSDVVEFYDHRFNMGLTDQQKSDLVAFLETL
jgi:cytochrome c peroxidase